MKFNSVIWDWNGTIVDDAWVFVDTMNDFLKKNNLPLISIRDYKKNFCFPIQKYWKELGFKFNDKEFNLLNKGFITAYKQKMFAPKVHPGIIGVIEKINAEKVNQFILSASENSLLQQSVNFYKLQNLFVDVWGVNNLNALGKIPLAKKLCLKYNLEIDKTILIGDTEYDQSVAQGIGCDVVLISHGHIEHKRLLKSKEKVVKSIPELEKVLFSL
jgi:phosphoglycolate phosphatase